MLLAFDFDLCMVNSAGSLVRFIGYGYFDGLIGFYLEEYNGADERLGSSGSAPRFTDAVKATTSINCIFPIRHSLLRVVRSPR